jgi:hypothetical protein
LLLALRRNGFKDGREQARWLASRHETWSVRARTVLRAFKSLTCSEQI